MILEALSDFHAGMCDFELLSKLGWIQLQKDLFAFFVLLSWVLKFCFVLNVKWVLGNIKRLVMKFTLGVDPCNIDLH